jgi:coenzyme F420-reducing hydrogenase delta subunit
MPFPTQAQVNPSLCVSCGICVGACPSSTPFRRTQDLRTGIDLPEFSLKELRERVVEVAGALKGPARVLVLACEHGAAAGRLEGTVVLPCVAMAPPSLIDFILSRDLADGVAVAGCAESACYNRLGVTWTQQRFASERDPYLRARVPRERIATIWASALAAKRAESEIAAFAARLAVLPSEPLRSPLPASIASRPAKSREPVEVRGEP